MNEHLFRIQTGRLITYLNLSIFGIVIVMSIFQGFTGNQPYILFGILAAIKSLYLTSFIKYIRKTKYVKDIYPTKEIQKSFASTVKFVVLAHFSSLALAIILCGINGDIIEFSTLTERVIPAIETTFGIYIGLIIPDLFDEKT